MKYQLEINGETDTLSVAQNDDDQLTITTSEKRWTVASRRIDSHHLNLSVDGINVNAFVCGSADARQVLINGVAYQVADADAQALARGTSGRDREEPREVTPPMPSVVVKVLVAAGQDVQKGDGLVVVSAMKMETTLTAPFDARVVRINADEGDKVMPGDILVDLETEDPIEAPRTA